MKFQMATLAADVLVHDDLKQYFTEKKILQRLKRGRERALVRFGRALTMHQRRAVTLEEAEAALMEYQL